MKIFLLGYGKMGQTLENAVASGGHEIAGIYDPYSKFNEFSIRDFRNSDVAIDFSTPGSAVYNITRCAENNIPVVVGTTGWYHELDTVEDIVRKNNGSIIYSPNFSIGVNIVFKVTEYLSKIVQGEHGFNISVHEVHHDQKKDSPSGTAINIANRVLANHNNYKAWGKYEEGTKASGTKKEIPIFYKREGNEIGTHKVVYESAMDRITVQHEALSREGFAAGTLLATAWIIGKKGIFTMSDILEK